MLLVGCEKEKFNLLKEEIGIDLILDKLIKIPAWQSLYIVRGREKT